MTRLEQIIVNLSTHERMAITCALFYVHDNKEAFSKVYGTYGVECLDEILKPLPREDKS